jgi:hypothetical protein
MGSLDSASTRTDLDPDRLQMHHMSISQRANKQKILLEELVCMYEILRVLDTIIFHPNAHIVHGLWYKGERFV